MITSQTHEQFCQSFMQSLRNSKNMDFHLIPLRSLFKSGLSTYHMAELFDIPEHEAHRRLIKERQSIGRKS